MKVNEAMPPDPVAPRPEAELKESESVPRELHDTALEDAGEAHRPAPLAPGRSSRFLLVVMASAVGIATLAAVLRAGTVLGILG